MFENYFIDPKMGIYFTRSAYGDEVERVFMVEFDSPDCEKQFRSFLRYVEKDGAKKQMEELRKQFKVLGELLS